MNLDLCKRFFLSTTFACSLIAFTLPALVIAAAPEEIALQGEYVGAKTAVQVVARGDGEYLTLTYNGGLPGAGWDGGLIEDEEGDADDVRDLLKYEEVKKVERKSPTLSAKPPAGAIVLFDGSQKTFEKEWRNGARISKDKLLRHGCTTERTFRDYSLHLEFRLPLMPKARGQARGNSGVYHQARYETQVLDSFGLEPQNNECGGIYELHVPRLNMCLPPLSWQTYDVDFTSATWDEQGKKLTNARMSVRLNGVLIHDNVEVVRATRASKLKESPEPGPIFLQDHGNPVFYRNIWLVERDAKREAQRPIVPSFERYHSQISKDSASGGKLLLGELGCMACHSSSPELLESQYGLPKHLSKKQAPNLDEVGTRLNSAWMQRFLANPHDTKPGTTMPDLLSDKTPAERKQIAAELTIFLTANEKPVEKIDTGDAAQGKLLFQQVGCLACHDDPASEEPPLATSAPLIDLAAKYHWSGLRDFLQNPLHVRPAGRMPSMQLNPVDAGSIASYLLRGVKNVVRYSTYHGQWEALPEFSQLTAVSSGEYADFGLGMVERKHGFGIRFNSFLHVDESGEYQFFLKPDDGSRLWINNELVVDADRSQGMKESSGKIRLEAGSHELRLDYFQRWANKGLEVKFQTPNQKKQPLVAALSLSADEKPAATLPINGDQTAKPLDYSSKQIAAGRRWFASLGCANCHERSDAQGRIASTAKSFELTKLDPEQGCLVALPAEIQDESGPPVPDYSLSFAQRLALQKALTSPRTSQEISPQELISHSMLALNCYSCHARGSVGGPERGRLTRFKTTEPTMGDEGRLPPPLNGVGDKLRDDWLRYVLRSGVKARPYMLARMPQFGKANVDPLVSAFVTLDRQPQSELPEPKLSALQMKAHGRKLVGGKALGCIKCHTFGKTRATGIQAVDMLTLTKRVREDWFHRYLVDPQKYRPGTRMPNSFVNGKSAMPDILKGDPSQQVTAIWSYLSDGKEAGIPEGANKETIELIPTDRPIIYRNFIKGLSPRAITVGYPQKIHLAWDAQQMGLRLLWTGKFIDASKHWHGRGQGSQVPLGDQIIRFENTSPVATLDTLESDWPTGDLRKDGYRFLGYSLDKIGRPLFRYENQGFSVVELNMPESVGDSTTLTRSLIIASKNSSDSTKKLYFRLAEGKQIEQLEDGWLFIDKTIRVRSQIDRGGKALLPQKIIKTTSGERAVVELPASTIPFNVSQTIKW